MSDSLYRLRPPARHHEACRLAAMATVLEAPS